MTLDTRWLYITPRRITEWLLYIPADLLVRMLTLHRPADLSNGHAISGRRAKKKPLKGARGV
jgi:hypothetical protein